MAFPRPPKRFYSEQELYEYAVGALGRRMRTVAELKRLLRARVETETEYGRTLVERKFEGLQKAIEATGMTLEGIEKNTRVRSYAVVRP